MPLTALWLIALYFALSDSSVIGALLLLAAGAVTVFWVLRKYEIKVEVKS